MDSRVTKFLVAIMNGTDAEKAIKNADKCILLSEKKKKKKENK